MEIHMLLSAAEMAPAGRRSAAKQAFELATSPMSIQDVAADELLSQQIAAANSAAEAGYRAPPVLTGHTSRPPAYAPPLQSPTAGYAPPPLHLQTAPYGASPLPLSPVTASPRSTSSLSLPSPLPVAAPPIGKDGKPKRFACNHPGCNVRFGQKGSLTRHIRSRHEQRRPHGCTLCSKAFSEKWTLDVHVRNVHLKQQPHECTTCGKRFGERWNLQKHVNVVHRRIKPFRCGICNRAFGYKGDMRKHVNELHQTPGRPFQCPEPDCGVNFARLRYLRRHQNTAHRGKRAAQEAAQTMAQGTALGSLAGAAAQVSAAVTAGAQPLPRHGDAASESSSEAASAATYYSAGDSRYSALHALSAYAESVSRAEAAARP